MSHIPVFGFPAAAATHLLTPEGWKAEQTLVRSSPGRHSNPQPPDCKSDTTSSSHVTRIYKGFLFLNLIFKFYFLIHCACVCVCVCVFCIVFFHCRFPIYYFVWVWLHVFLVYLTALWYENRAQSLSVYALCKSTFTFVNAKFMQMYVACVGGLWKYDNGRAMRCTPCEIVYRAH